MAKRGVLLMEGDANLTRDDKREIRTKGAETGKNRRARRLPDLHFI